MLKILLISLSFSLFLYSSSVSWYSTYDTALKQAHKKEKDMMILLVSSKDKSSLSIVKKLFMNKEYVSYLNENYINVLINVDYKSSYPIELFYTTTFPSLFFASHKDESYLYDPIYTLEKEEEMLKIIKILKEIKKNRD